MDKTNGWQSYATICRLCLQKDGFMFGIFNHNSGNEKSLYKKIVDCTALQITMDDGLPNVICHRCLYKIDFCLEFRQQCFVSDAALRRIHNEHGDNPLIHQPSLNFHDHNADVVMVVDPNAADYNSDIDAEVEAPSENDNSVMTKNYGYGFSSISLCRYCDYAFMNKEDCVTHETEAHNTETPYQCEACNVDFVDRMHFLTHLKNVHKDDKPFKCPHQCSRTFARRSDLRKHTIVHTGIKPFTCKVCFKSFSRNTNLSKHMRIHSGHKLFSCKKCHKKFLSKADLGKHSVYHTKVKTKKTISKKNSQKSQQNQANINGDNIDPEMNNVVENNESHSESLVISVDPFNQNSFNEDDDQVSNSSRVSDHHNVGYEQMIPSMNQPESYYSSEQQESSVSPSRPFGCSTCKKSFMRKRELDRHILTHTGMKPFKCNKCDKSFGRKDKLVRHMRIHDVNKQFACDMCEETFSRRESLSQHQNVYHTSYQNNIY